MHWGLKGTMSALFLKTHALKVRRGQAGRVRAGKIPGGLCYGYRVVRATGAAGELVRGEREIVEAEGDVVRRIFRDTIAGFTAREIAAALNWEGVPAPRGALGTPPRSTARKSGATASCDSTCMLAGWFGTDSTSLRILIPASALRGSMPRMNCTSLMRPSYALSRKRIGSAFRKLWRAKAVALAGPKNASHRTFSPVL